MARKVYRIDEFRGIDQSRSENAMNQSYSIDACNMDTTDGALKVASGFSKHIIAQLPTNGIIYRLVFARFASGVQPIVAIDDVLCAYKNGAWSVIYTYKDAIGNGIFDFVEAGINSVDYIIIACGEYQLIKYDGETVTPFGSAQMLSDIAVGYLAMYKNRLFSAGDAANPNRLYWSKLPGGTRSIEDWGEDSASVTVSGGHTEVGGTGNDPITALYALSNQLLIFKERSLYRLIGDRPSNFVIERVDARTESVNHMAIVECGDVLYFLTKGGLYCFNGVSAAPLGDARCIRDILKGAVLSNCRGALAGDKLYFAFSKNGSDLMMEYDLVRRTYMLRNGFAISDISGCDGKLFLANSTRYIYVFDDSVNYAGAPIIAWWRTPTTDLYDKGAVKAMRELYLRGKSDENDSALLIDITVGNGTITHRMLLPENDSDVLEIPLKNEGRTFSMKFCNEAGGHFSIDAGVEVCFEQWRRVE